MTQVQWRGDAPAVAQLTIATPANVEIGDVFSLTINGKSVSYTAAAATVADVTAGLTAAVNDSEIPEFGELVASDTATEISLTAATPGVPFTVAASTIDGGGTDDQTLTLSEVFSSSGPNDWATPGNWSTGAVPDNGDDVFIEYSDASILYGLDQASVVLSSLNVAASFDGEIGLSRINTNNTDDYVEYRPQYLAIGAATVAIGSGRGDGSGRIQLDLGNTASAVTVRKTAPPIEFDLPSVLLTGSHAENTVTVVDGSVGIAIVGGETAIVDTLRHAGGNVQVGPDVALDTVERAGEGELVVQCHVGTLTQTSGSTTVLGAGAIDALTLGGGRVDYRSTGDITSALLTDPRAVLDFSADLQPRTVANCTLQFGAVLDPHQTVTWSTGIQPSTGAAMLR
jgi:hypothetical protein